MKIAVCDTPMKGDREEPDMFADFEEVELGLVVRIKILREVLKTLSIDGRRWWIASDPQDAMTTGSITIGHGDPQCKDRLNTLYFRFPVLGEMPPRTSTDKLVLLVESSVCTPEEPGLYLENGRVMQDFLEDFTSFYPPIKDALIARLIAEGRSNGRED
jgi:hypothetical protein